MSIAELAGAEWLEQARNSAISLSGVEEETPSTDVQLLMDIMEIFGNMHDDKIMTAELIDKLCSDEEMPWAVWNIGNGITPFQLSKRLKRFDIAPTTIRFKVGPKKGYLYNDFVDPYSRYAPQMSVTDVTDVTEQGDDGFVIPG